MRGASIAFGIQAVLKDLNVNKHICIRTDASAAKGIASRRGLGKVRHIEVNQLWLQDKVMTGEITLEKIPGTTNPADILTKHVDTQTLDRTIQQNDQHIAASRHELMPQCDQ